ncbi:competence protein ComK [Staphylococcus succinus]|nr:competence protein ComK [Staphylococcus succinus]
MSDQNLMHIIITTEVIFQMTPIAKLLYFKSVIGPENLTISQFTTHQFTYPSTINNTLHYFLETHQKSYTLQIKQARQILKIRKFVPIYVKKDIILFPLKTQRAPIQYYINAHMITGLKSQGPQTIIFFENGFHITIDSSYMFIYKKWQESLTLSRLLQ